MPAESVIVDRPTTQTVSLGTLDVNLSRISRLTGIHISRLSRIFAGHCTPTLDNIRRISEVLQMSIEDVDFHLEKKRDNPEPIRRRSPRD